MKAQNKIQRIISIYSQYKRMVSNVQRRTRTHLSRKLPEWVGRELSPYTQPSRQTSRNNWHKGALEPRLKPAKAPNYDLVKIKRRNNESLSSKCLFDRKICSICSLLNDSVMGCFGLDSVCGRASCSSSFVSETL